MLLVGALPGIFPGFDEPLIVPVLRVIIPGELPVSGGEFLRGQPVFRTSPGNAPHNGAQCSRERTGTSGEIQSADGSQPTSLPAFPRDSPAIHPVLPPGALWNLPERTSREEWISTSSHHLLEPIPKSSEYPDLYSPQGAHYVLRFYPSKSNNKWMPNCACFCRFVISYCVFSWDTNILSQSSIGKNHATARTRVVKQRRRRQYPERCFTINR